MGRLVDAWHDSLPGAARLLNIDAPLGPPVGRLSPPLLTFLRGQSDFAFLTREISEHDLATYRADHRGNEPVLLPIAAGNWQRFGYTDAVVFVVHPSNPLGSLSFAQVNAIFSAVRKEHRPFRFWGDLGLEGAWASRPIEIVGGDAWAHEESARALTVRRHVLSTPLSPGHWLQRPGTGGDGDVVELVSSRPGAIGFTGRGHVKGVSILPLSVDERSSPVELDQTTARSGAYPLLRTVDLLIPTEAKPEVLELAQLLLSDEGQGVIDAQGDFLPLPGTRLSRSRSTFAALRKIRQGWHKAGIGG